MNCTASTASGLLTADVLPSGARISAPFCHMNMYDGVAPGAIMTPYCERPPSELGTVNRVVLSTKVGQSQDSLGGSIPAASNGLGLYCSIVGRTHTGSAISCPSMGGRVQRGLIVVGRVK